MKTLGKDITRQFFQNECGFDLLEHDWRINWQNDQWVNKLEPIHFFLYQAFRGKDWRKAFTPITNQNKLDNGYHSMGVVRRIFQQLKLAVESDDPKAYEYIIEPLGSEISINSLKVLVSYLPTERNIFGGPSYVNHNQQVKHRAA